MSVIDKLNVFFFFFFVSQNLSSQFTADISLLMERTRSNIKKNSFIKFEEFFLPDFDDKTVSREGLKCTVLKYNAVIDPAQ